MRTKTGRYSGYIRPFSYLIDFIIINIFAAYIAHFPVEHILFPAVLSIAWFCIAAQLGFYEVYRYTKVIAILNCALRQGSLFAIVSFALAFFYAKETSFHAIVLFIFTSFGLILIIKFSIYFFLRKYRVLFGGNFRRVVLLGNSKTVAPLQHFFTENLDYGYQLIHVFDFDHDKKTKINEMFAFVLNNRIDEMYCSMSDLSQNQMSDIVDFADNNLKTLKFIPDEKQLFFRNFTFEYYDYIPVITLRNIRLDEKFNKIVKRIFDIAFSILIIIGILFWLTPILAVLIKFETRGPVFFKQKRNGLNNQEFYCYKFRSMEINDEAHLNQVSKNDTRVTKIGKIIRKTSMDELPQFFNVLQGNMSVVGPRPHMVSHTEKYALKVDKFMVRHFIKPGITGLAQTRGFRGEVESDHDIINRVKYDIFYVENWSILLDIKIILNTIYNTLKGDKKAY
ncbi:exopolysaccharide biosynthesis polyprenyl glycosylphosphotransferase [Flavobacterium sp. Fl-77]|uniref:Exopolysaccharide biosynthesis polyprenyl glycosylphosphotransferase n=1 Tax=Flavobacterium flavipigmentatum TaxID=2893884 RepID=A0AAJ2W013_9FLAO|nr:MULTISPECIES: exopolysaccharide biosynthesis polyprenyl glycosylphosphotransferase [unclassified Flavobacterium]MDX6180984.1 exopolysaccharide biosynthesis polyprenyl glycosylphosphotransferase [Flavobacterium sp. Fl-33]MDX6184585.1 exopolysaccharide biosynthesis polyprenyl glycosylphosphotransferase [Flavobacterium sp. Fl-77]UFH39689.1 exopolysaccharide biosynthesis polyprenyl glycosylphosphotransferase [Flavobacterium sp. F-70]